MDLNIFKSFTLKWWQSSLFKVSVVSFGILLGVYFTDFFSAIEPLLWILMIVPGVYLGYVWIRQPSQEKEQQTPKTPITN